MSPHDEVRRLLGYEDWLLRQLDVVERRLAELGVSPSPEAP